MTQQPSGGANVPVSISDMSIVSWHLTGVQVTNRGFWVYRGIGAHSGTSTTLREIWASQHDM